MYNAKINFYKEVENDNYSKGCYGGVRTVYSETFDVEFENKEDLLKKIAKWTTRSFDVSEEEFLKHVENECEENRFDYAQPEDDDGSFMHITEDNPEGYYAMYFYNVEVYQKVDYSF